MPRLNKYIASCGICSRRKADELIESGCVNVNDRTITELGFWVREKDKVTVKGKAIRPANLEYFRFNKPPGYITTSDDEKGRKTIYDILPKSMHHLKPVGRLDKDSTGLLILTNDGDFINEMTHPSIKVPKIYHVSIDGKITKAQLEKMAAGIEIEPKKIAYADVLVLESDSKRTLMQVTLYQGMNRQIRRMFESLGHEVKMLKRIQHAIIQIEGLKKGEYKVIKPRQIKQLKSYLEKISIKPSPVADAPPSPRGRGDTHD